MLAQLISKDQRDSVAYYFRASDLTYAASRNDGGIAIETWEACISEIAAVYAHSKNTDPAFKFSSSTVTDCYDLFANAGKYGVYLKAGARARIDTLGGTAANIVTAGAFVGGGSQIASAACTLVSTGAVAVAWGSGAAASAWPAANNKVDDAIAALVVGAN